MRTVRIDKAMERRVRIIQAAKEYKGREGVITELVYFRGEQDGWVTVRFDDEPYGTYTFRKRQVVYI